MNRREFCGAVGVMAAGAAIGAVAVVPEAERANSVLLPVLEITDRDGNVIGYSNRDFAKAGATVRANGKLHNVADLRGEWKTSHQFTVVGEQAN